jgi:anti-anti-sigma factor
VSDDSSVPFSCECQVVAANQRRVVVLGEIDLATSPRLTRVLREAQHAGHPVVLDLGGTTFIDTGGARILLDADARARATASTFTIVHAGPQVERLLRLVGAQRALAAPDFPQRTRAGDGPAAPPSAAHTWPSPLLRSRPIAVPPSAAGRSARPAA